jgi:periplasmic divalent cation tolerance protein
MRVVLCNCPVGSAATIARQLVEDRLAACVNLIPVQSVYVWDGLVQEEAETTLVIKVSEDKLTALREKILALHPYDLPEIVALAVDVNASHAAYVAWVRGG